MAVDIGKSVISQATNKVFRKVAGGLNTVISSIPQITTDTSDVGQVNRTPYTTENFQFPLDVLGPTEVGNHGHYIMFYINEQENAKLSIGEREDRAGKAKRSIVEERNSRKIPKYVKEWVGDQFERNAKRDQIAEQLVEDYNRGKRVDDIDSIADTISPGPIELKVAKRNLATAAVERAPTRRLKTAIALYMPPNIQTTYGAQYTDTEIGTLTENVLQAYDAFQAGKYGSAAQAILNMDEGVEQLLTALLLSTAGALPGLGGLREVEEFREGRIFANRMELAFKNVAKRQFQYTFKMIPRSQREAEEIRKIVFAFKANMLPEFKGDSRKGRQLIVPNTFDIEYMYNGKHNSFLHHVSTCFLENMTVNYGGDRFTAHADTGEGAPPTETSITLNFREIETMTRERIFEGY